jgi:hypothetical protein
MMVTPKHSLDDQTMWRRLIAATHPDAGGDDELCVFAQAARDAVCSGTPVPGTDPKRPTTRTNTHWRAADPDRVPFEPGCSFTELTRRALKHATDGDIYGLYGSLVALLDDCRSLDHMRPQESLGASYKELAYAGTSPT